MADISSNDEPLFELALFAGAGGGILGGKLLRWRTVCAVEINAYAASVLVARQDDGCLEPFPIWDDIRTFRSDNSECAGMFAALRGIRHRLVISGGFPCQDISVAGAGAGLDGERSGLWSEQARIIREIRPAYAFVENSPALTGRGLHRVLADLAAMGFNAEWGVVSCVDVGGVHLRERIWIKASDATLLHGYGCEDYGKYFGCEISESRDGTSEVMRPDNREKRIQRKQQKAVYRFTRFPWGEDVRGVDDLRKRPDIPQPLVRRIGHDVANGMDRLAAIGNGQVPRVAATAWRILSGR